MLRLSHHIKLNEFEHLSHCRVQSHADCMLSCRRQPYRFLNVFFKKLEDLLSVKQPFQVNAVQIKVGNICIKALATFYNIKATSEETIYVIRVLLKMRTE